MAKAANSAPAKDKALEADILNEGAKASTPIDQQAVKDAATDLGNTSAGTSINDAGQSVSGIPSSMPGTPAPGHQMPQVGQTGIPPVANTNQADADQWGEKEKNAAIAAAYAEKRI